MQYLLLILFAQTSLAREWIDPHDMDMKFVTTGSSQEVIEPDNRVIDKSSSDAEHDKNDIYLKRIVRLIISSAYPDRQNDFLLKGIYYFRKDSAEYEFLLNFMNSKKIDSNDLRQLEGILQTTFSKSYAENILNIIANTDNFINIFNSNAIILLAACMALLIFIYLLRSNFGFWYIFNYFLFIIWIIDYAIRYQQLLEVPVYV